MTGLLTTKLIKDATGGLLPRRVYDVSGTDDGPFIALQLLASADGTDVLDLEAMNAAIVAAIGSAAATLPAGAASDAALASILAKLSGDPATQTTQAAVLAKLSADPATQTTTAAILAKLPAAPALDASLGGSAAAVAGDIGASSTNGFLRYLRDKLAAGIALGAGTAVIGKIIQQVGGSDIAATNPLPVGNAQIGTVTATIVSGTSLSSAADLGTGRIVGLVIPATWTSAAITFQGSADGATFFDLYDDAIERTIASGSVSASRFLALPLGDWLGIRAVKLRSGTAAASVNQPADRAITLVTAR